MISDGSNRLGRFFWDIMIPASADLSLLQYCYHSSNLTSGSCVRFILAIRPFFNLFKLLAASSADDPADSYLIPHLPPAVTTVVYSTSLLPSISHYPSIPLFSPIFPPHLFFHHPPTFSSFSTFLSPSSSSLSILILSHKLVKICLRSSIAIKKTLE